MTRISFQWTLGRAGSADCTISDGRSEGRAHASYISNAPEDLLNAVTRVVLGARMVRAQFEGEPGAHRWIFHRYDDFLDIDLLRMEDGQRPDSEGQVIWESRRQGVDSLASTLIDGFDRVAQEPGEDVYRKRWLSPFPRTDLEDLRTAWRDAFPLPGAPAGGGILDAPANP
ncbi:hypothetical protein [Streptomyces sp. CBMA156]|uniref:hypothetical protein n=1 Tax=Streptomyces sp. CBMA156 TaxID=1930280 RepID=UPI001661BA06|nr:hypothetical protein [Streptomyces sp. CBMA156]MBD0671966.1 hypothetical protein [Streptomyces sp. CBMA156]